MLALIGSGEYLPPIEAVDRELIARLGSPVRVACLPTAAGQEGAERIAYWSQLGIDHFKRLNVPVTSLPVIDKASANDPSFVQEVSRSNFIYLSGGKPDYLYETLQRSSVWEAIQTVLAQGGLLAGCSAGAMIMGERLFGFTRGGPGFSLLPRIVIVPHYDEIPEYIVKPLVHFIEKDMTVVGVEGSTALVKTGEQYEVLGSGGVTVWDRRRQTRFTQGTIPAGVLDKI